MAMRQSVVVCCSNVSLAVGGASVMGVFVAYDLKGWKPMRICFIASGERKRGLDVDAHLANLSSGHNITMMC